MTRNSLARLGWFEHLTSTLDPAPVFACALSLREACLKSAEANSQLNLSDCYNGMDEFMREMMRIGNLFEAWACEHVAFDRTNRCGRIS